MRKFKFAAAALLICLCAACGSSPEKEVTATVTEAFQALTNKNMDKFYKLVELPKNVEALGGKEALTAVWSQLPDEVLKQMKFEVSDPKVTGNTATCKLKVTIMGQSKEEELRLVNDKGWKIVSDSLK